MTRKLPWLKSPSTSTPQAIQSPRNPALRAKRRRILEPSSDIEDDDDGPLRRQRTLDLQASLPTSLGPPSESLMDEGLDKDDGFRMVEDEFLDMAKQFTQHLHAAEYQRLKRAVRSQNVAFIGSISRPVSVRMPDETRRKVESVARAKRQAAAVHTLVRRQGHAYGSDEDSDVNGGAWLGTALHGLMESPRKSVASLKKFAITTASTIAEGSYDKSRPPTSFKNPPSPSSDLESFTVANLETKTAKRDHNESFIDGDEDEDDDDDLDAPVRSRSHPISKATMILGMGLIPHASKQNPPTATPRIIKQSIIAGSSKQIEGDFGDTASKPSTNARERIAKRLEQARLRGAKSDEETREKLGVIPMFLS